MASTAVVLWAGPAAAADVTLNPDHIGETAAGFPEHDDDCGNAPDQDGWHFIVPGNVNFTSLTLTFDVAGDEDLVIVLGPGDFGPPDDSHAFVSTPAGAILKAGSGTTDEATPQGTFNLSHTCPATTTQPPTTQPPTSEPPTSEPPTSEPPTSEPPTSEPPTTEPPTTEPPTMTPTPTRPPADGPDDDLPDTGSGIVPILVGLGLTLIVSGAAVVIAARRRPVR